MVRTSRPRLTPPSDGDYVPPSVWRYEMSAAYRRSDRPSDGMRICTSTCMFWFR
jgi:hypothetical protein